MTLVDLIPRRVLFGNPERTTPKLSPDGSRLAYIAPVDGVLNIWVGSRGGDDAEPVTTDRDRGIQSYAWAHDNRHLLYLQDVGGTEDWHVYVTDLATGATVDATPFENVSAGIVAMSHRRPDIVLLSINARDPQLHDIHQLTLSTGELTMVAENEGYAGLVADEHLVVRCATVMLPDGGGLVLVRDDAEAPWREVMRTGPEDGMTTSIVGFTADNTRLLLRTAADSPTTRLVSIDLRNDSLTVLAQDSTYDVTDTLCDLETNEPLACLVLGDRPAWTVLADEAKEDVLALDAATDGAWMVISRTRDDRTWLVVDGADTRARSFHIHHRDTGERTFLFRERDDLAPYTLAPMEPFTFTARDGLLVHGYVTLPVGTEHRDLPAVLNVHGGPWTRDTWRLSPEVQWLANRGYAVIQVNYRGSTGYGKDFVNASNREWAGKMHLDLLDAIDHIASTGVIDPERVCIYGGSYGGYAALVGATFTPERFVAAVDIVGPSNLNTLIRSVPAYWQPMIAHWHQRVGNPDVDEEFLWSRSPLSKVDNMSIPLLIAHGSGDPRVKEAESEQIVAAMQELGIAHEYLVFPDEGHGFTKPENKFRFYARAEAFLAEHVGGRCEPPSPDEHMTPTSRLP